MKRSKKVKKLVQIDWVDFSPKEKEALLSKPEVIEITSEVVEGKSEYEVLVDMGQMDLLDPITS